MFDPKYKDVFGRFEKLNQKNDDEGDFLNGANKVVATGSEGESFGERSPLSQLSGNNGSL